MLFILILLPTCHLVNKYILLNQFYYVNFISKYYLQKNNLEEIIKIKFYNNNNGIQIL